MRRMYSKEQLQKLIDEVSRLIAIEELDKVVPIPALDKAGYVMTVNAEGTGYELKNVSGIVDGATIRPANVFATTKITANEIVENMSGYNVTLFQSDITWNPIYVGIVKNGNKITLVIFGSFVYASGFDDSSRIAYIEIPSAVADKLYPFTLEGKENVLASSTLELTTGLKDSEKIYYEIAKVTNLLDVILRGVNSENLTIGRTYLFRIEQTFLLSENLIPQE